MKNFFVYRLVKANGTLAYVGQTGNFNQRIVQLQSTEKFRGVESVELSVVDSREAARLLEQQEIRSGKPELNIQHNKFKYQMELFKL